MVDKYELGTDSYAKVIQSLHKHLPHLRNILREGRGKPVKLECYEYAERKLLSHKTFRFAKSTELPSEDNDSLGHYLENVPSNPVQLQILVATDLSISLMNCLGASLGISVEMFEEHLLNSGWRDGHYDDSESNTWITRNMIKDYTSLKWYRPVTRILSSKYDADRKTLLSDSAGGIKWRENTRNAAGKSAKIFFEVKPFTNILRREWDLRTDPRVTSSAGASSVWEERATIWTRQHETYRTGMFFFVNFNIETESCVLVVLLLDPLPMLQVRRAEKWEKSVTTMGQRNDRHWARKSIARLTRERPSMEVRVRDSEQPNTLEMRGGAESGSSEFSDRPIYDQLFPRGPIIKYESIMLPQYAKNLAAYMSCTKSTAEDLSDYLNLDENHPQEEVPARDPLDCLFAIIQSDTLNTLHLMGLALSEIGHHMLIDTLIQHRLVHWRNLLENVDVELNKLEFSLRDFTNFLEGFYYGSQDFPALKARIMKCATNIAHMKQHTERTNKSLMANMSIVESKRGIAQAESVTKLTELAFFFIPLTFSASIFGMQVKELSKTEVSLRAFLILAVTITTSSYALRLIIRSNQVIRRRQNLFKRIRENYELQPGDSIPTTIFLAWLWGCLGSTGRLVVVVAIVSTVPLSIIWTSSLVNGVKVGITILICIILGIPFVWNYLMALFLNKIDSSRKIQRGDA